MGLRIGWQHPASTWLTIFVTEGNEVMVLLLVPAHIVFAPIKLPVSAVGTVRIYTTNTNEGACISAEKMNKNYISYFWYNFDKWNTQV